MLRRLSIDLSVLNASIKWDLGTLIETKFKVVVSYAMDPHFKHGTKCVRLCSVCELKFGAQTIWQHGSCVKPTSSR